MLCFQHPLQKIFTESNDNLFDNLLNKIPGTGEFPAKKFCLWVNTQFSDKQTRAVVKKNTR